MIFVRSIISEDIIILIVFHPNLAFTILDIVNSVIVACIYDCKFSNMNKFLSLIITISTTKAYRLYQNASSLYCDTNLVALFLSYNIFKFTVPVHIGFFISFDVLLVNWKKSICFIVLYKLIFA